MRLRLAVVRDFLAEGWPSMDLCADQLLAHLPSDVIGADIAPAFRHVFGQMPFAGKIGFNADRLLNRHFLLPRGVRQAARQADFVHIVDHSYAHLVTAAPRGRAGVYCHDLDAFRSVLEPEKEPRPWWFRRIARRILTGLKQAAVVFHNSVDVGNELVKHGLVPRDRLVHAPLGVAPEFKPEANGAVKVPVDTHKPFVLHVGNNIPRKRLDVLLDVFANFRQRLPQFRLVQVGGPWPDPLRDQIQRLGIGAALTQVRGLTREQLAELYRRAAVVLVPSEAEGFGLPVIEALACGAAVIASDIPTLREAGGPAAIYRPVGDVPAWVDAVFRTLSESTFAPDRDIRLSHAARFSWREHARIIASTYRTLAERRE